MGAAPASGREELVRGGLQGLQVVQVLPGTLVGRCVELEVDLVEAGGEENREPIALCAPVRTLVEALRQAEIEEGCRPGVEPALAETEVTGDDSCGATTSTSRVTREVSPSWKRWRETLTDGYAPVRERLLALLDPWPGVTVLELAPGAGDMSLDTGRGLRLLQALGFEGEASGRLLTTRAGVALRRAASRAPLSGTDPLSSSLRPRRSPQACSCWCRRQAPGARVRRGDR